MGSFQETRLNLEPPSSTFVVDLKLPSNAPAPRTRRTDSSKTASEINDFRSRTCATASSVYRRKHYKYPASFLWRVLEDDTVLSVQSVDVAKPVKAADANLVLNFHFPNPIRPTCIALADPVDHDALIIFVLDTANQLYTLFLRPDSFRKRSFAETGLGDVCKVHTPNSLKNFKSVYRLLAVNSDQLIAALYDGGLIRFDRDTSHNAVRTPWKETFYNSKGWGLKNLLPNRGDIDMTAAAASVHTNMGYSGSSFLLSVCVDHRLRVWNLNSGQILKTLDLLNNSERNPQETGKWQIEKSQTNLIRIIGDTDGTRLCVTYSPVGCGEFKFWKLESDDVNSITISDALEGIKLVPKPPYVNDVWTLADFAIAQGLTKGRRAGVSMSLLWKNNMAYRVQQLSFVLPERGYDYTDLKEAWDNEWPLVHVDDTMPHAEESGPSDPCDVTEKWLSTILAPGRFPKSSIEAAVGHYERSTGVLKGASSKKNLGLAEAMCNAVVLKSSANQTSEQFRTATERQWRTFYRILLELDKPRGEALSLAYDVDPTGGASSGVPWVICADRISLVRSCSDLEALCHRASNSNSPLSALLATGKEFVEGFSDGMKQICKSVLRAELFEETTKMDNERIQFFSDKAGFWRQISDEDCNQVTEALGANFELVTDELYAAVLEKCNQTRGDRPQYPVTDFGRSVVLKSAQDIAEQQWKVCFDQLILLVHMEFEFDRPEDALHNRVNIGSVYRHLLNALHRLELIRWLGNTQVTVPLSKAERNQAAASGDLAAPTKQKEPSSKVVTALEANVGHLLGFDSTNLLPTSIANAAANLCAPGSDIVLQPENIQCYLLLLQRPDLALDLSPFCDQSPFSTYVQGRVSLALQDFQEAATYFKKAAYGMSVRRDPKPKNSSSGLLDETEWNLLYEDQPRYYAHIVALFEKLRAYSHVVDFTRLSLQLINNKSTADAANLRMEMQSRLFQGALSTSRFELAHATLVSMKDHAIQKNCLGKLVGKMCDELHTSELVSLSFPGLQNDVDEMLSGRCRDVTDVVTGTPYHQILYAWRIRRNDYRGAAKVLMERIEKLRASGEADNNGAAGGAAEGDDDVLDTPVTRQYLMLINVLSCVEPKQAWITTEGGGGGSGSSGKKRRVVTLADIRKEYQDELDRIAAIENNQFGFTAEDEMEIL